MSYLITRNQAAIEKWCCKHGKGKGELWRAINNHQLEDSALDLDDLDGEVEK